MRIRFTKSVMRLTLAAVLSVVVATTARAYDFTSTSGDVTTYFNLIDEDGDGTYDYAEITNDGTTTYGCYSGDYSVSSCVTYDGVTYPIKSIGASAFRKCTGLTSITLTGMIEKIDQYAFYQCTALTELDLDWGNLESIGNYAFNGCTSLKSVTFGSSSSVTSIPSHCFYLCTSLTSVTLPSGLTTIGDYAFGGSSTTKYVPLTSITIPESVTSIGLYAFAYNAALASITIPESVTSIGSYAFAYNAALASITIPDNVTSIGVCAFRNCYALGSIKFPSNSSFTTIPNYCCYLCSCLTAIDIPESVTTIGNFAFAGSSSTSSNGPQLTKLTIPMSVTSIGTTAFKYCPLKKIICEATSVPTLSSAFSDTTTPIYVPTGCASSYQAADNWSSNADYISEYIPEDDIYYTITTATYDSSTNTATREVQVTNDGTSTYCTYSGSVTIPSTISPDKSYTVTSIGQRAFSGSSSTASTLTAVTIPNTVTTIGNFAFGACSSLTSVTIPASVTSLGTMAFSAYATTRATIYCSSLKSVTFEEGSKLTTIGASAFRGASALTSVTLPNSVTSIGSSAFYGCTSLTSFTFPENDDFTEIPSTCLGNCFALKSITIPASVTSIGVQAFYCYDTSGSTSSLSSLTFESGSGLTEIGNYAFQYNCSLTSVTLPYSVTTIGTSTFNGCTALKTVRLSNSLTSVGASAFANCTALTSVYARNKDPQAIATTVFPTNSDDETTFSPTLYVPKNWAETYSGVEYWSYFSDPSEYEEEFYLTGTFNSWAENDEDYKFSYGKHYVTGTTTSGGTVTKLTSEYYYIVMKASDLADGSFKIISDLGELSYNGTISTSTYNEESEKESNEYSLSLVGSSTSAAARSSIKSSSDNATSLSLGDSTDDYVVLHIYETAADTWSLVAKTTDDSSTTGISDLAADGRTVVSEKFYNLSGAEVAAPSAGQRRSLYIVVKEFSDGTTAAVKEAR